MLERLVTGPASWALRHGGWADDWEEKGNLEEDNCKATGRNGTILVGKTREKTLILLQKDGGESQSLPAAAGNQ